MRWQRAVDEALAPLKLAHTRYLLLDAADRLDREGGDGLKQRALVEATHLGEPAVSSAVRALEDQGLLGRTAHEGDARRWSVHVTAAGTRALTKARPVVEALAMKFSAEISES